MDFSHVARAFLVVYCFLYACPEIESAGVCSAVFRASKLYGADRQDCVAAMSTCIHCGP